MDAFQIGLPVDLFAIDENALRTAEIVEPDVIKVVYDCAVPPADVGSLGDAVDEKAVSTGGNECGDAIGARI
jgi:hypothetical protein